MFGIVGLSLSRYRFAEIRYHRPEETHKGRQLAARVETVVLFLPDVWSCMPTSLDWEAMQKAYKNLLNAKDSSKEDATQALIPLISLLAFLRLDIAGATVPKTDPMLADFLFQTRTRYVSGAHFPFRSWPA